MNDPRSEGSRSRINPTIYDDIMSSLGLTECKSVPSPVEFEKEDPLGIKVVSRDPTFDLTMRVDKDKSCDLTRLHRRTLGEQAYIITSMHDRALALKPGHLHRGEAHSPTSTTVLECLAGLASQFLNPESPTNPNSIRNIGGSSMTRGDCLLAHRSWLALFVSSPGR